MWKCNSCGLLWDDEEAPDECPKCQARKAKFAKLGDKAATAVERARFANNLLMQLHLLMDQVMDVAEDGVDDNLDPACVQIFTDALEQAETLQQVVKAEMQAHVTAGSWG